MCIRDRGTDGSVDAQGFPQLDSAIERRDDRLQQQLELQCREERRDYSDERPQLTQGGRGSVQRIPQSIAVSIDRFVETVATKAVYANSVLVLWRISNGSQTNWMFVIHCCAVLGLVLYYNDSLRRLQTAPSYDVFKSRQLGFYGLSYSLQLLVLLPTWAICV